VSLMNRSPTIAGGPIASDRRPLIGIAALFIVFLFLVGSDLLGARPDGDAEPVVQDLVAGEDSRKRYFLIGGGEDEPQPKNGYGLVFVLPGGSGGADFLKFVTAIHSHALPQGYLVAQLVSVKWTPGQDTIWPTRTSRVEGQEFTTEEFVQAVKDDVAANYPLDPDRTWSLSWSSGGPAAYAVSLQENPPLRGSYIAQSVFMPHGLRLDAALGQAYFFDHSPEDAKCLFWNAQKAAQVLGRKGAATTLVAYEGGHGWHGDVHGRIRSGIEWLEKNAPKGAKSRKMKRPKIPKGNLLFNGGFELGDAGWMVVNNSDRATVTVDEKTKKEGKKSLHLSKRGGPPFDLIRNDLFDLPRGKKVKVSALVKAEGAERAILKFYLYDAEGETLNKNIDVAVITGSMSRWKEIDRTFDLPGEARSAAVMFLLVRGGEIWLDDVQVRVTKR